MAKHNNTGKWGEDLAADYLREKGYEIIERDWRDGHRDIDIIARSPDLRTIVFVEVLDVYALSASVRHASAREVVHLAVRKFVCVDSFDGVSAVRRRYDHLCRRLCLFAVAHSLNRQTILEAAPALRLSANNSYLIANNA